jgi:cobyrinic acid a,c-diamide synthase
VIAAHVDIDAVVRIARDAGDLPGVPWDPTRDVQPPTPARSVVAMAGGRAFTFRYTETEELLCAAGCDVVEFDPLLDATLPPGTAGIYLGGGFPEVHAAELGENRCLIAQLRSAIAAGIPTVAECAGLLYLCRSLDGTPMVGAVPADAAMTPRLTLGYRTATSPAASVLTEAGERVTGHEFHRTAITSVDLDGNPAWHLPAGPEGFATPMLHAAYLHTHWAGHPALAQRFAQAVHESAGCARPARRSSFDGFGQPPS